MKGQKVAGVSRERWRNKGLKLEAAITNPVPPHKWQITTRVAAQPAELNFRATSSNPKTKFKEIFSVKTNSTFANKCLIHSLVLFLVLASVVVPMAGCGKVQQVLNIVLQKEPSVIAIVNTALDLYKLVDPQGLDSNLKATVDSLAQKVTDDIRILNGVITTYQADLAAAPSGVLAQVNALYASIDSNLAQLSAALGVKSAKAQNEVALILDAVDVFLSELGSFLPAPAAAQVSAGIHAQATVKTKAALTGAKVKLVSAKDFVKHFNSSSKANFPQIQIAVPQ